MNNENNARVVAGTWSGSLQPPEKIPATADVVVIGGGIVGVSTAWFLARQGVNVVLCEKGYIAGEQSGRNWGWVRQQGRDPRELPMMIESLRIFRELESELGESVGFTQGGCLFTANSEKDMQAFHEWLEIAKEHELDTRVIDPDELGSVVHGAAPNWLGAMYTPSDGRAEPHMTTPAIARAATRAGATLLTSCAVRGIESAAGRVSAVVTEHGSIQTSSVLCATGAWTSMFCRSLGISVPQLKVRGTVARTAPAEKVLEGNLFDDRLGIRRREDGGYTVAHGSILDHGITPSTFRYAFKFFPALMKELSVLRIRFGKDFLDELSMPRTWPLDQPSPFEQNRVLNPEPSQRVLKKIRRNLHDIFPQLAGVELVESWAGMVETTPDVVPVIGEVGNIAGLHIATGLSGHGFGIGPGAGKALAAMLTGADNPIDLKPFRLSRFFDGTPIRPQTTI
ncbi:MAG: NAD(P)/FAD-dependent oxidoreductase [Woeseiaceae bacterium]